MMNELLKELNKIVKEMEPLELERRTDADATNIAIWTMKLIGKVYDKGYKDGLNHAKRK